MLSLMFLRVNFFLVFVFKFSVHEDPDAECKTKMSVLRPRALKLKREEFSCPVAVFEPPDPTKVPMYPKQQVGISI